MKQEEGKRERRGRRRRKEWAQGQKREKVREREQGKIAWWLRMLAALAEDLNLVLSTCVCQL